MRFRRPAGMLPLPVLPELITERHSTVLSTRGWHDGTMNYPKRRFWRRGRLTNERDGERERCAPRLAWRR